MGEKNPDIRDHPSSGETGGGHEQGNSSSSTPSTASQKAGELATKAVVNKPA